MGAHSTAPAWSGRAEFGGLAEPGTANCAGRSAAHACQSHDHQCLEATQFQQGNPNTAIRALAMLRPRTAAAAAALLALILLAGGAAAADNSAGGTDADAGDTGDASSSSSSSSSSSATSATSAGAAAMQAELDAMEAVLASTKAAAAELHRLVDTQTVQLHAMRALAAQPGVSCDVSTPPLAVIPLSTSQTQMQKLS